MKVYVAASGIELGRAKNAIARLDAVGIRVVSIWPKTIEAVGASNPRDASDEQRAHWSSDDLDEVASCDVLWCLVPPLDKPTRGAWIEVGFAHARGKSIVFSGDTKQSIFCALGTEVDNDDDAFTFLRLLAREESP